jgi:integrase-like protein
MGHIERRVWSGKASYRARYRDPAGRERSKSFRRKADAERWLAEIEHTKTRGMWTDPRLGRIRFADWLAAWWSTTTNLRPTTQARDETLLRLHALPRFGKMPLVAITQLEVRAWVAELSVSGLAPATVVKTYQLLGKLMGAAVDAGYLAQTPCRNVPLPKIEQEEMRFLGPTEIVHLAEVIHPRYRALVFVGAYGGLRIGELAGLRRRRVDLMRGAVTVAEIVTEVKGSCSSGRPRRAPAGERSGCRPSSSASSEPISQHRRAQTARSSPHPSEDRCGSPASGRASGSRPPGQPVLRACVSTIFDTQRWRCGSPLARLRRRSPCGPAIPQSASRWTATATCIRSPTPRSVIAWRRCIRPAAGRRGSHPAVAVVLRPQNSTSGIRRELTAFQAV